MFGLQIIVKRDGYALCMLEIPELGQHEIAVEPLYNIHINIFKTVLLTLNDF